MTTGYTTDIPLSVAIQAHAGTSFSPERRGATVVNDYAEGLREDYALFQGHAAKGGTLDKLDAEFERYRAGCRARTLAYLRSSSRCMSTMIAGPSNFPARRMNKRAEIAHRRLTDLCDFQARARAAVIRNLRPDLAPIRTEDADAVERLTIKIARAEALQRQMKQCNATIRRNAKLGADHQVAALVELGYMNEQQARGLLEKDFAGRIGFPDYALTNNGANIRRMKEQLAKVERAHAAVVVELQGTAARFEDDPPSNRVRLYFPAKPDDATRTDLKKHAFRWSPTIGAWQAYRNYFAIQFAKRIAGIEEAQTA